MVKTEEKIIEKQIEEFKKEFEVKKENVEKFVKKEFEGLDYAVIVTFSKVISDNAVGEGISFNSINKKSRFDTIKTLFSNMFSQHQSLSLIYQVQPAGQYKKEKKEEIETKNIS